MISALKMTADMMADIPVDGSEHALNALRHAISMAESALFRDLSKTTIVMPVVEPLRFYILFTPNARFFAKLLCLPC
jgi:hypothetical protein